MLGFGFSVILHILYVWNIDAKDASAQLLCAFAQVFGFFFSIIT